METIAGEAGVGPIADRARTAYAASTMQSSDPDAELVQLARDGNARAFEALVVKYQRRVARHVARYVRRPDDVEDVVQEVFIKAHRGLASFRGDSAFYTWIYRIASNCAMNFVKRSPKHVVLSGDMAAPGEEAPERDEGSEAEDPQRLLLAKQVSQTIERAMERMPADLAEALTLYEVEGKAYKEIAQMLEVPIGTVRIRIFRAREFLAKRLEPIVGPMRDRRW